MLIFVLGSLNFLPDRKELEIVSLRDKTEKVRGKTL